jgi:hypothetical protein
MSMRRRARLAVLLLPACIAIHHAAAQGEGTPPAPATQAAEDDPTPASVILPRPLSVRFRLADGSRITGELTAWDRDGIDGSFGRRQWIDLHHDDIRRLYRRVMDEQSASDWVGLGRALLLASLDQEPARKWAERCFERALTLDEEVREAIEAVRAEAAEVRKRRAETEAAAKAQRLATGSPEAVHWPATPWPELTAPQQAAALEAVQAEAWEILERAGLPLLPSEGDYVLLYTDMTEEEAARWAARLNEAYALLADRFDLPAHANIFHGKAVVFIVPDRDRFRLIEAASFNQLVDDATEGICNPIGPDVFIVCQRVADDDRLGDVLVRQFVHGFMHRYRSPHRLPAWANEGLADYYSSVLFRNTTVDRERRAASVAFIRRGGDVDDVLNMSYDDEMPPQQRRLAVAVGALVIEVMIREQPERFARWVDAVKEGIDWEKALGEEFGVPRAALVETVVRYYQVND